MDEQQKNNHPFYQIHLLYGVLKNYKGQMDRYDLQMEGYKLQLLSGKQWCYSGIESNNNQCFINIYLLQNQMLVLQKKIDDSQDEFDTYKLQTVGKEWIV